MRRAFNRVPVLAVTTLLVCTTLAADTRFYADLLQRGISDAIRGEGPKAVKELRIAAFGLIEDLPQYETAQIYIAVASEKMNQRDDARTALLKAVQAERMAASYTTLRLDASTRSAFEKLLTVAVQAEQFGDVPTLVAAARAHTPAPTPTTTQKASTGRSPAPVSPSVPAPSRTATETSPQPPSRSMPGGSAGSPQPSSSRGPAGSDSRSGSASPATTSTMPIAPAPQPATQASPAPKTANTSPAMPPTPQPTGGSTSTPQTRAGAAPGTNSSQSQQKPLSATNAISPAPQPPPVTPGTIAKAPAQLPASSELAARLSDAETLLNEGKMIAARQAYAALAQTSGAPRSVILEAARGLSQTSGWYESSRIYTKLFPLKRGEEKYYLYEAINRYELGELSGAREFLARALPYVPNSRELAMYRAKIEATQ